MRWTYVAVLPVGGQARHESGPVLPTCRRLRFANAEGRQLTERILSKRDFLQQSQGVEPFELGLQFLFHRRQHTAVGLQPVIRRYMREVGLLARTQTAAIA